MEIRALRTIRTDVGNLRRGDTTDKLSEPVAKSLIKRGFAELISEAGDPTSDKPKAPAKPKPHVKAAPTKKPAKSETAPEGD